MQSVNPESYTKFEAVNLASDYTVLGSHTALYVGASGDVVCHLSGMAPATNVTFKAMPVGIHKISVDKVIKTGTTATNLLVLS